MKKIKKTDGAQSKKSQRLTILSEDEAAELYAIPQFNKIERTHYFLLPEKVLRSFNIMKTNGKNTSAKLWFILQYGYFRARHQFFNVCYGEANEDVSFIMTHYLPNDCVPQKIPSRRMQGVMRNKILLQMGYSDNIEKVRLLVSEKVSYLAKTTHRVTEIFNETIKYLDREKIVLPNYSHLQDMIGRALTAEDRRLIDMMKCHLNKRTRKALENLLKLDDGLYRITEIKLDAKSFQTKEMQGEIEKTSLCRPIYVFAQKFLSLLGLSRSMIEYYASLARFYHVGRLSKISRELAYLYLVCYVHGRYERLTSNLIQGFVYYVDKYHNAGKKKKRKYWNNLIIPYY